MKKFLILIYGLIIISLPQAVLAQTTVRTDFGTFSNIGQYIGAVMTWAVPIVGSLAVLMTIYAGYLYMTSQGNQESISLAKDIMMGVILGILLLFTVWILMHNVIGIQSAP